MKALLLTAVLLLPAGAFAEDGHFTLPPGAPANNPIAGNFGRGGNDRAPDGCDANVLLPWMKAWRQRAREGYVNGIVKYIPSLAPGARCIQAPAAFDVRYEKNGDYFVATCLAQKNGQLSHLFRMDIDVPFDQACLGDARFNEYVKGTQCKMPGGNQRFLREVMMPCAITPPNSPIMHAGSRPTAYPIDPAYFARLLNDRPEIRDIVDETTRKVKVGPTGPKGPGDGCTNPFGCDSAVDGNSRDVK